MGRTQLGRQATGLARYYMDCGWHRHPRFAGLDPAVLFVFSAMVSYCTEHATDGRMPADVEDLSAAIGVRLSHVRKSVGPLIDRDALQHHGGELVIRGWGQHNPTSSEVQSYTEERSRAGAKGNHIRHHESRGIVADDCQWCRNSDGSAIANGSQTDRKTVAPVSRMGWDGMGKSDNRKQTHADRDSLPASQTPSLQRPSDEPVVIDPDLEPLPRHEQARRAAAAKHAMPAATATIADAPDEGTNP